MFYAIESIKLTDYTNGFTQTVSVKDILPLFLRTESKAPRYVEDRWIRWGRQITDYQNWTNICMVVKYI